LGKLKIQVPTDFQQQLLEIENDIHNVIITAPSEAGKVIAIVLLAIKKFINEEEGIIVFLSHSKDLSQQLHHVLSSLTKIPTVNLYMQEVGQIENKHVIIGSPLQVNNLWKKEKDNIIAIVIPEVDYLFGFGYGDALELLAGSINCNKIGFKLSCITSTPEIEKFKNEWMKKTIKINYEPPVIEEKEKMEEQITHFYASGDKVSLPISLYVTLKFGLVNPKILVIV
jgi:superfamily II DNA/RNA helicase